MFDGAFNGKTGSLDWSNLPSRLDIHNVMAPGSRHRFLFGVSFLMSCMSSMHHGLITGWTVSGDMTSDGKFHGKTAFNEGRFRRCSLSSVDESVPPCNRDPDKH